MNKFKKIKIGQTAEIKHTITAKDLESFAELTGDDNKLHVDEEYASKTIFKKPVVHGMLGASFISTLIGTKLPGDGALWFSQNLDFLSPVRVGDQLTVLGEVIKKTERNQSIELAIKICNQHKQIVTSGTAKIKVVEIETPKKKSISIKEKKKKIALVIGATGGIGQSVCHGLAEDGFDLIIHTLTKEELAKKIARKIKKFGVRVMVVRADIKRSEEVSEMFEKIRRNFNSITVLVNCASAKTPNIKFDDLSWDNFEGHLDLNIKGTFNLVKHVLPLMKKDKFGKIISITTQYVESIVSELSPYITAKSALSGLSKALAIELAPLGIRVNMVSPGMTDTEFIVDVPEKARLLMASKTPLKRLAEPEEIAGAISFLASEKSDYLVGETIRVNGGQVML
jgi:3-oxoacyl-[acyl-carrier protein] reductase